MRTNNTSYSQRLKHFSMKFLHDIEKIESKYIGAPMKPLVRGVFLILVLLATWKFVLRQKVALGMLPGDLNYRSSNIQIHAPFVTCMVLSFLFNALVRIYQRN